LINTPVTFVNPVTYGISDPGSGSLPLYSKKKIVYGLSNNNNSSIVYHNNIKDNYNNNINNVNKDILNNNNFNYNNNYNNNNINNINNNNINNNINSSSVALKKSSNIIINKGTKDHVFDKIEYYRKTECKGTLDYSFMDILGIIICCWSTKYKNMSNVIEKGKKKLTPYLDYLEIVKHFQNLEKLMKIVFNRPRQDLFRCSKKPRIIITDSENGEVNDEKDLVKKDVYDNDNINYYDLYDKYQSVKCAKHKLEYDDRLIEQFDYDIKMPFDILIEKENRIGLSG